MRARLRTESGMTLVELVVVMAILGIILAGISSVFSSGLRASSDVDARLTAQTNAGLALSRFELEVRCASAAATLSSGAGVALTLPSQCTHGTGSVSWCVTSGVLTRYAAASCSGTSQSFVGSVTSATPFSCNSVVGSLPQVVMTLTVNATGRSSDGVTATDKVTMRNAPTVTAGASACT